MIASEIDELFVQASHGDRASLDTVFSVVYPALKKIARGYLYGEPYNQTLQVTGLVNETYLKLAVADMLSWADRRHFLTLAARAMRQVLVDYARARNAGKRGDAADRVPLLTEHVPDLPTDTDALLALDAALLSLERSEPRHAMVINLRYFAGLSIEETAAALDISPATAKRDWTVARLWLLRELETP